MLAELLETRPRSIRQMWKDPMTEDGVWLVLMQGVGGDTAGGQGQNNNPGADIIESEGQDANGRGPQPTGPIIGVSSRSTESGMRTFFDSEAYSGWRFTVDLLAVRPPGPDGIPIIPRAAWIGSPA